MLKRLLIIIFILIANISFVYAKKTAINLACMPPEGNMKEDFQNSYVAAIEGAFLKAGHYVSDRQRLENIMKEVLLQQSSGMVDETSAAAEAGKIMKVDYLVAVILYGWREKYLTENNSYIYYDKMRITIKLIEVETSRIVAQEDFQGNQLVKPSIYATKIVKNLDKQLKKYIKQKNKK